MNIKKCFISMLSIMFLINTSVFATNTEKIEITGDNTVRIPESTLGIESRDLFEAKYILNNREISKEIVWSTDTNSITVDHNGYVYLKSGYENVSSFVLTASLKENPNVKASKTIMVERGYFSNAPTFSNFTLTENFKNDNTGKSTLEFDITCWSGASQIIDIGQTTDYGTYLKLALSMVDGESRIIDNNGIDLGDFDYYNHRVKIELDFDNALYNFYVDKEVRGKNLPLPNSKNAMNIKKLWFNRSQITNLAFYSGFEFSADYVVKMNDKKAIEKNGAVTANTEYKRNSIYTAKWTNHTANTQSVTFAVAGVTDWSTYDYVSFWAYSKVKTDKILSVFTETSTSPKWRYCWGNFIVDWEGWKKVTIDLTDLNVVRYGTLQSLKTIGFSANSWNAVPDERTVLYIDDIFLEKVECENPVPETDAEFENIRSNWRKYLGGDIDALTDTVEVGSKIDAVSGICSELWSSMNKSDNAQNLWGTAFPVATSTMTYLFSNINKLAQGYAIKGSIYYKNDELLNDIRFALNWMYENMYGADEMKFSGWRDITEPNWWDWQIGSPTELVNTLMLLYDVIPKEEINNYLSAIKFFVPQVFAGDANKASITYVVMATSVLSNDSLHFRSALRAVESFLCYADETAGDGEGFYTDGSYIFHGKHAMNGTYGIELIKSLSPIIAVLGDNISGDTANMLAAWFYNGFEPLIYNGAVMSIVKGRYPGIEHTSGATVLGVLTDIIPALSDSDRERIKSYIKHTVISDSTLNYYSTLTLSQANSLYGIMNDENVLSRENYKLAKVYGSMDRAVWQRGDFAVGISMSSSRIFNYESISGCNNTGWYMGDGMVLLYNGDSNRYNENYWNKANKYRLPGTTADSQTRQALSISNSEAYLSTKDFVGGVTLDNTYAAVAMDLESFHSDGSGNISTDFEVSQPKHDNDLTAKKAWFMFDDEVVALGCEINSTMNSEVVTTVENAPISNEVLSVNSEAFSYGSSKSVSDVSYANIGNTVGYWFPNKVNLDVKYNNFAEILWSHGKNPVNEAYEYVMLPDFSQEETKAYSENPHITVLSNDGNIQAVRDEKLNATGIVFRSEMEFEDIIAENPCIVMKREEAERYTVSVAEPTHKIPKTVIKIKKNGLVLTGCDEKISISEKNGYYVLSVNTLNSKGKSFEAVFQKEKKDSPVRMITEEKSGVKLCFTNSADTDLSINLIIAEYDAKNRLSNLCAKPYTVKKGESEICFNSVEEKSGCTYRWFVWQNGSVMPFN